MEVAECIGGPSLAGVMRLLAQDHAGWAGALLALCSCRTCMSYFLVAGMMVLPLLCLFLCR